MLIPHKHFTHEIINETKTESYLDSISIGLSTRYEWK